MNRATIFPPSVPSSGSISITQSLFVIIVDDDNGRDRSPIRKTGIYAFFYL